MASKIANNAFLNQMFKNKQMQGSTIISKVPASTPNVVSISPDSNPNVVSIPTSNVSIPSNVPIPSTNVPIPSTDNSTAMNVDSHSPSHSPSHTPSSSSPDDNTGLISLSKNEQLANKLMNAISSIMTENNIKVSNIEELTKQLNTSILSVLCDNSKITCNGFNKNGNKCLNSGNFLNQNGYCKKHIDQDHKAHLIPKKVIIEKTDTIDKTLKIHHHCQASKIKSSSTPYDNCSSPVGVKMVDMSNKEFKDTDGNTVDHVYLCNKHLSKLQKDMNEGKSTFNIYPYDKCSHKLNVPVILPQMEDTD